MTIENIKINGASDGSRAAERDRVAVAPPAREPYKSTGAPQRTSYPQRNGRVGHLPRLGLPYAYNYGGSDQQAGAALRESTCSHELGLDGPGRLPHLSLCEMRRARPAAEMSKQNAKHIPGDWSKQKQLCTVCGFNVMGTDTRGAGAGGVEETVRATPSRMTSVEIPRTPSP